ncbi:hypothetical protein W02_06470 [Nitrospira sp. KM1]|uniref:hypothetical protein n=1 Tax=Nitrospira sp. KM1 TaxID=1936990 RepID=UPI0013A78380|nr:hypothetical protein [Nitrospira sp. KM1]BCA53507.1 hypothetical protein W02_06470 [Nitrospira sp. KM1]
MDHETLDTFQLAGLDDRERGFSRPVEFEHHETGYRANLRYESTRLHTDSQLTQDAALLRLVEILHARGYRQLKSQMTYRRGIYIGSQEIWVEYPDPVVPSPEPSGLLDKLLTWFRPHLAK